MSDKQNNNASEWSYHNDQREPKPPSAQVKPKGTNKQSSSQSKQQPKKDS